MTRAMSAGVISLRTSKFPVEKSRRMRVSLVDPARFACSEIFMRGAFDGVRSSHRTTIESSALAWYSQVLDPLLIT